MKFTFTDKKVTLPKKVHEYAEKKVGKLERYFPTEAEASVVFSVEKGRNNAEVTVRSGGTIYRVWKSAFGRTLLSAARRRPALLPTSLRRSTPLSVPSALL